MIGSFFEYLVIGVVAIIALRLAIGLAFGLLTIAAVVVPVALVGYVIYRVAGGKKKEPQISEADRKWLES